MRQICCAWEWLDTARASETRLEDLRCCQIRKVGGVAHVGGLNNTTENLTGFSVGALRSSSYLPGFNGFPAF